MKIAPSMLSCDFSKVSEEIKEIEKLTDIIHLDVMDGHFVPNITFGASIIKTWRKCSDVIFDTHLMIENVSKYVDEFCDCGSDYVTFHVEVDEDIDYIIDRIHEKGKKAGLSVKPGTSVSVIEKYLHKLDLVLVMSVEPGFGGQSFMYDMVNKVDQLIDLRKENNYSYLISIDGGINKDTIKYVKDKCDFVVCGSFFFKGNKEDRMKELCQED